MKKVLVVIVLIALVIGLAWTGYSLYKKEKELERFQKQEQTTKKKVVTEALEIQRKVNEQGLETVLFDITANKQPAITSTTDTKGIIDTVAMALDIRTKQLKQILVVKSTLEAENLKLKKRLDIYNRPYYTYQGEGLDLRFTPPNDLDSVARADFKANVKLTATQYWKRNWFLGAKKSILAISSDNPRFKINGSDFVEFEQDQPSFGLRIQASGNYNPKSGNFGYGPAARIDAGRFSFQGNYTYYPTTQNWSPSVNVNFDLIRF